MWGGRDKQFLIHVTPVSRQTDAGSPDGKQYCDGRTENRDGRPSHGTAVTAGFSAVETVAQAEKSFAMIAFCCTRVVTALWEVGVDLPRGPLPARQLLYFNPTPPRSAFPAGACPLYARAIVILFTSKPSSVAAIEGTACTLPSSRLSLQNDAYGHS